MDFSNYHNFSCVQHFPHSQKEFTDRLQVLGTVLCTSRSSVNPHNSSSYSHFTHTENIYQSSQSKTRIPLRYNPKRAQVLLLWKMVKSTKREVHLITEEQEQLSLDNSLQQLSIKLTCLSHKNITVKVLLPFF